MVDPGSQVADYRATIKYVDMTKWTRPLNGVLPFVKVIDNSVGLRDAEDEIGAEGYLFAGAGKGSHEAGGNATGVAPWMVDRGYSFGSATTAPRLLFGKYNDAHAGAFFDAWIDFAGFEWFPCHEWLGTTDVLAGYWGMKRVVAEKGTLTSADGAIWRAFQTSGDGISNKEMIMGALGQVKACVNRMTNGKRQNLSFITDENTVMKLTRGFEYQVE